MSSRLAYAGFSSLLSGPTVKIVWGPDQKAVVPEALLRTCHSPSLDASPKPVRVGSRDGIINWKEQDSATIERFLTWLYRGDYNAPDPQPCSLPGCSLPNDIRAKDTLDAEPTSEPEPEPETAAEPAPEPDRDISPEAEQAEGQHLDEWPRENSCAMQHVIAESCDGRPLTPISSCLAVGLPEEHQISEAGIFAQGLFPYESHHYKEVLLAHARLYTFATYHNIKGLQDLSLQRLTQALTWIDCGQPHAASEIAALLHHVYHNTLPAMYFKDAARKLVSQFAAVNFDELVHGEFETLLEAGGDLVLDISRKVSRQLRSAKKSALLAEERTTELESKVRRLKKHKT